MVFSDITPTGQHRHHGEAACWAVAAPRLRPRSRTARRPAEAHPGILYRQAYVGSLSDAIMEIFVRGFLSRLMRDWNDG